MFSTDTGVVNQTHTGYHFQEANLPAPKLAEGKNNSQLTLQHGKGTQEGTQRSLDIGFQNVLRMPVMFLSSMGHGIRYFPVPELLLGFHRKIWPPFPCEDCCFVIFFALLKSSIHPLSFCLSTFLKWLLCYIVMFLVTLLVNNTIKKIIYFQFGVTFRGRGYMHMQ